MPRPFPIAARLLCVLSIAGLLAPFAAFSQERPAVRFLPASEAPRPAEAVHAPLPMPPSEAVHELTLGELQGMALARHPSIAQGRARVDAARSNWVQVGLRPNPEIGYVGEEIGDEGQQGLQGGFIRQRFVTADKLTLNRQVATQQIFVVEQRLAADRQRVLNDVRVAFYDALIAQRRVAITRQLVQIGRDNVAATQKAIDAMFGNRIQLLEAEVDAQAAEVELEKAEARLRAAWRRLAAAVAVSELPDAPLDGSALDALPELDWQAELARLLHDSPEVAAAANEVDRAQWALRRAEAERYADFEIGAAVLKNNASGDTVATVELSMPLKLYDRNQGGISEAAANYRAAAQALQKLELALQRRLADAFQNYSAGRSQATRYAQQVLPRANESRKLVQQAFSQGEIDFLQLLTSERTYNQANLIYLDALERAWTARIEIEGLLLRDSLGEQ